MNLIIRGLAPKNQPRVDRLNPMKHAHLTFFVRLLCFNLLLDAQTVRSAEAYLLETSSLRNIDELKLAGNL
jgi:hypothetical protein